MARPARKTQRTILPSLQPEEKENWILIHHYVNLAKLNTRRFEMRFLRKMMLHGGRTAIVRKLLRSTTILSRSYWYLWISNAGRILL